MTDHNLPVGPVARLIKMNTTPDIKKCSSSTTSLTSECLKEFIQVVAQEAQMVSESTKGRSITPEHLITALTNLGYSSYAETVKQLAEEEKEAKKTRPKMKKKKLTDSGLTMEQLAAKQKALFARAKANMN
mmetsp:Transcript_7186/g.10033  ORF Transcript_7186/g.10033 Transcript_7186/m.10033 type:complete len:131 (-) Transcript_7186:47-439(-)|eukprot:CAMPEP_0184505012 /NCGR_PEP_ID=MMETSP0113_2-20130426/52763_1 /TAXON_ID=91329 /ORGANISM="Norrisiella sphaerica, Strain BC52" /LENGTH=130 /DNA_ID=CAMNT_0026894677 /DNA_START=111 /DNA_END=503 /DNA_ORIENTATION=+